MSKFIHLYRNIMKQHKQLTDSIMKKMGNDYVRQEFKSHLINKTTTEQLEQFIKSWDEYLVILQSKTLKKDTKVGITMNANVEAKLSNEQKTKLKEFKSGLESFKNELDSITKMG